MNAAILIAGRELRDRSRLFLIATVLAAIPFIAALTLRDQRHTGMAMTASFLALGYAAVVALTLGISAIGRELTEKRTSFLFSKPVSPAAMWFGKTAAAVMICVGAFAIIALPTYFLARDGWADLYSGRQAMALYTIILCIAMFFGGHVASTMLRSRSARVLLDAVFLALAVFAVIAILRPLLAAGGGDVARKVVIGIGVALVAVLVAAPVWQLARGRVDPLRNHVALSTVFWGGVAIILVVAAAYVMWVMSPPLASVTEVVGLDQSPTGEWVFVSGLAPGRGSFMASYLMSSKTGERERLTLPVMGRVHFSQDGKVAAWMENEALLPRVTPSVTTTRDLFETMMATYGTGKYRLHTRRLEAGAKRVATPLIVPLPRIMQLSHDGSRVALVTNQSVEVHEVATGRLVASAPRVRHVEDITFVTPNLLRMFEVGPQVRELDIASKQLTTTAVEVKPRPQDAVIGEVGESRLLVRTRDGRLRITDRATGNVEVEVTGVRPPMAGRMYPVAAVPRYTENATFIGIDRERRYLLWDAKTGAKRPFPS
jgi:ABC-type transport system involved in multi-copper enzyme maturation permease subunit